MLIDMLKLLQPNVEFVNLNCMSACSQCLEKDFVVNHIFCLRTPPSNNAALRNLDNAAHPRNASSTTTQKKTNLPTSMYGGEG